MMHRLQYEENDVWSVVDENDEVVFSGTFRQCEDWLDRREQDTPDGTAGPFRWLLRWIGGFFAKP